MLKRGNDGTLYAEVPVHLFYKRIATAARAFGLRRKTLQAEVDSGRIQPVVIDEVRFVDIRDPAFHNLIKRVAVHPKQRRVVSRSGSGKIIRLYPSIKSAAADVGVRPASISKVLSDCCSNKTAVGLMWDYFDKSNVGV